MSLLIKNARIIDKTEHLDQICDLFCSDGIIKCIGDNLDFLKDDKNAQIIDGKSLVLAAGFFDMHVHLRDPGQTQKEDLISGTNAAAAGGVTSLLAMPNTVPSVDCPEVVTDILTRSKNLPCNVYVCGAISKELKGEELTDIDELKKSGITALSDDGRPVLHEEMLEKALVKASKENLLVTCHCEDLDLAADGIVNKGEVSEKMNAKGISNESEYKAVEREITLAKKLNVPVHIAHVSTKESIELIRKAKSEGVKVTCETAPHYFIFTDQMLLGKNADFRMNPPLRSEDDRKAVIEGLKDGTIDAIVTDHAPHTQKDKSDFYKAPNGVIGMESTFASANTYLVDKGEVSLGDVLYKMSKSQADILKVNSGVIALGKPADLVLLDINEVWTFDRNKLHGKSKNTPFDGMSFKGKVKYTVLNGEVVYTDGLSN